MPGISALATILQVEEEASRRAATRAVLEEAGHTTFEAATAAEAGQVLAATPFDLVLLSGPAWEALAPPIRQQAPELPVLYLTPPETDPTRLPESYLAGRDAFLIQPVAPAVLLASVDLLLRVRRGSWRYAFAAVSDAMCLVAADGTVVECNPAMAHLAGLPVSRLEGSRCSEWQCELHDAVVRPLLAQLKESHRRETVESCFQGRWLRVALDPVKGGAGGAVLTIADVTDRKQAEAERERLLAENARQRTFLDAVLDHAPEGLVVTDAEARVVLSNRAAAEMLARPAPYGEPYAAHARLQLLRRDGTPIPPRELPLVRAALDGEEYHGQELSVVTPDGRRRDLLLSAAPLRSREEERAGAVAVFQDVTEATRVQQELSRLLAVEHERAQLGRLLEAVLDYTPSAIGYLDGNLDFVFVNPAFAAGTGRSRQEFLGCNLRGFPVGQQMAEMVERVRDTGQPAQARDYPFHFPRREAEVTFWDWSATPVKDAAGVVQGVLLTAVEVSENVHVREQMAAAEQARARETRLLTTVEETAPCMLAYLDRELRYVHANSRYAADLGLAPEEVIGRTHPEVFAQADPWAVEAVERVCETGQELVLREMPSARHGPAPAPEGGRHDITITPVKDERGRVEGVVIFVVDVTERVKQREALVAAQRERAQLAEALNAEISHRMKNNLMAIVGLLQMQVTAEPDSRTAAALHDAMARLLTFADLHTQLRASPGEEIDLLGVLSRLAETIRAAFAGVSVAISVQGQTLSYPSPAVTTLALVANELVTNAIKHGAPGADGQLHVDITVAQEEAELQLRVWNSGSPVPESFDPHTQAGLGLRLVWDVVVGRHHGSFTLRPEREGSLAEVVIEEGVLREEG